jgi:succinoglycan biosynthesis protein ExoA
MVRVVDSELKQQREASRLDETVSVIIPCYNEERFIRKALEQLADQFEAERYEIIVIDGMSDDGTRAVIEDFRKQHPGLRVRVVDNPARNIPTALNLGIAAAEGSIIARMDAHAVPSEGYIKRCVEVLQEGTAGVVGMPCIVRPGADTVVAHAIAAAVSHPFGIGDAKYRLGAGGPLQEAVDTVAFSCFTKSLGEELGGFNESLLTNEDYDFNYRVRESGRKVILDRSGHCEYFARASLKGLASQYRRYGGWKARMLRLHPRSIKLRHLVAPGFVLSLIILLLLSFFSTWARLALVAEVVLYFATALLFGAKIGVANKRGLGMLLLLPVVFFTIHFSWGASFLLGLIYEPR